MRSIALLGEYTPIFLPHIFTNAAINPVQNLLNIELAVDWVSTEPSQF